MIENSYLQWYNGNELRAYPLSEQAPRVATNGRMLPDDILVDACIMVPPGLSGVYLSSIRVTPALVSLSFSTPATGLLVGTFARSSVSPHKAYPLTSAVTNVSGWVAFGNNIPNGIEDYTFAGPEASAVECRAVRVIDALPVTRFVKFGGRPDKYVDKVVRVVGGAGILVEKGADPGRVIVRLKPELMQRFLGPCNDMAATGECVVPPIRRLAGVCPDANGTVTIRFE